MYIYGIKILQVSVAAKPVDMILCLYTFTLPAIQGLRERGNKVLFLFSWSLESSGAEVWGRENEHISRSECGMTGVKVLWRKIPKEGGEERLNDVAGLCYIEW